MTGETKGRGMKIRDVGKRYGSVEALRGVSIDIEPGSLCTLLGPSGSGKTTLLKLVAGFETPDAGTITIGDREVTGVSAAKRNLGMVFQNYALFPHMTVAGNVAFPLEMRKAPREQIDQRVRDVLSLVSLDGLDDRLPGQLSGGQQQRVALARAIVFDPDILLMDEPLGALDRNLRQQIQVEVKTLQRRLGVTVLYVTHDQDEALDLSDRIAVMRDGRIEQIDTPQALYDRPATRFVATFLGECNLFPARIDQPAGRAILEIGAGLPVPWHDGGPSGPVTLGLRPEKLRLGASADALTLHGVVQGVTFTGADFRITVEVDGQRLVARHPNCDFAPPAPGTAIGLAVAPDDLVVLEDEPADRSP